MKKIPVIDVTDLYHPYQDCGDNIDILTPYSLPEIDLKAVILDATDDYRQKNHQDDNPDYRDHTGPREPGIIPISQLNYLYGCSIPFAHSPFSRMKSIDDQMTWVRAGEQLGVELLLETLRNSPEPVNILIFSSCRTVAVAYNRAPELLREKVAMIHVSAGSAGPYVEWNVMLDRFAFKTLIDSPLPLTLYPCAGNAGPFELNPHSSYWFLPSLGWIGDMEPELRSYLCFALQRACRHDWLACLGDEPEQAFLAELAQRGHHVWETAIWLMVSGYRLVRDAEGNGQIRGPGSVVATDEEYTGSLVPATISVTDEGVVTIQTNGVGLESHRFVYHRAALEEQQRLLQEALPSWYCGFRTS